MSPGGNAASPLTRVPGAGERERQTDRQIDWLTGCGAGERERQTDRQTD